MKLNDHPTVKKIKERNDPPSSRLELSSDWLKALVLECGADDCGFVSIDSEMIADQKDEILKSFPSAKFLISIVCRMNPHSIKAPQRSVANNEFHHTGRQVEEICRDIVKRLRGHQVESMNEPMAFPMELADFPGGKTWIVSHKTVAVAAGMGQMGIHRSVIHPRFGSFILLGSVVIDRPVTAPREVPIDFNPCLECKLCVVACPVGAIHNNGYFNVSACMTHNYREFMGGFVDWVKSVTDSNSMKEYQKKVTDGETVSMWQSLTYGANYKAAYCIAVCPAGEDVISPFLNNRREFVQSVVRPLQEKEEVIYVVKGTDAADHVQKRFPKKKIKFVGSGLSVRTIKGFLFGSTLIFQPGKAKGLSTRIHFRFSGEGGADATYIIENQALEVLGGHIGSRDLLIECTASNWLSFVRGDLGLIRALITRKIKVKGNLKHFRAFGEVFPTG